MAFGVRPLAVLIKNAGESPAPFFPLFRFLLVLLASGLSQFSSCSNLSPSSSSSSEDSSLSLLPLILLGLVFSFSTFGLAPRLTPLFSSFWWNIWMSRASRMFSSGSQVLYFGLQPFHLTRYSGPVLPALCLYKVLNSFWF